jgi:hypothetical protein
MSKIEKKKQKLIEKINELEQEVRESLTKKTSNTKEINVAEYQNKIRNLSIELANLK